MAPALRFFAKYRGKKNVKRRAVGSSRKPPYSAFTSKYPKKPTTEQPFWRPPRFFCQIQGQKKPGRRAIPSTPQPPSLPVSFARAMVVWAALRGTCSYPMAQRRRQAKFLQSGFIYSQKSKKQARCTPSKIILMP